MNTMYNIKSRNTKDTTVIQLKYRSTKTAPNGSFGIWRVVDNTMFWTNELILIQVCQVLSDLCNDRQKRSRRWSIIYDKGRILQINLKRSDAFSPTTFKNTPKTVIPSNINSVQISGVGHWPDFTTTICQFGQTVCFQQLHCSQLFGAFS